MREEGSEGIKYSKLVDYKRLDAVKRMALRLFEPTLAYPESKFGIKIIPETLGTPAVAFDYSGIGDDDYYPAGNMEVLGTKISIADGIYYREDFLEDWTGIADKLDIRRLYRNLGHCATAMANNDMLALGADAYSYFDAITCGDSEWFSKDYERTRELLQGYRDAADTGKFAIPQGETSEQRGIVDPRTLHLAGASRGLIRPKSRLITGSKIKEGDSIFGLESSGIHSNGVSNATAIADKLKDGLFTDLGNGKTLGEELLTPTTNYSPPVLEMLDSLEIHYAQPITGHGWWKIARYPYEFTYVIEQVPEPSLVFRKLIEFGGKHGFDVSNRENYFTWNMRVGFVMIAPESEGDLMRRIAKNSGISLYELGHVEKGPRRVVMPFEEHGKPVIYTP